MDLKERNQEMKDFFNEKADGYDAVHLPMMANKAAITEKLPEGTRKVLDLGAGTGLELVPLFERFPQARVKVVDISIEMLSALKERPFADRLEIECGDFFEMEFGEGFDAVISSAALHHFEPVEKARLYKKVFASLRPGGVFVNSDRCYDTLDEEVEIFRLFHANRQLKRHFDTPLSRQTEERILTEAGFTDFAISYLDPKYRLIVVKKPE